MAQTMVDLALGSIRDLLVEEFKFLSGVGGQVKDVQTLLQRMQRFLEEVDRRKSEEPPVLNYMKEIRSLCYRIEDAVDAHVAVEFRKRRKGIKSILKRIACLLCEYKRIRTVGTEIASIKEDISSLITSMEQYGNTKTSLERKKSDEDDGSKGWPRRTYGFGMEKDFVGMKKDIDLLVAELRNGKGSKHGVVSIWGMGGLGKTTLAEKIYHHKDIRRGFEAFGWVCISKNYKLKNILEDLLVQLIPKKKEEAKSMGEDELVREVHKVVQENKCLVVLDDVWESKDWKCLQPAFPLADASSKVLITTRKKSVAKGGFVHPLGVLSEDEAWELLQKKAFIRSDCKATLGMEPKALENLGRKMVRKCGYLPLAIALLGGILSEKKSLDAWESVNKKNIDVNIRGEGSENVIEGVLSLSYDDLPYRLKPCFLCLSRFPEDALIHVRALCLMWIAEGLVSPEDQKKDETLRDVALRYFSDLASRSLVQYTAGEFFVEEDLNSFRIHDLLRELCLTKSMEEEFLYVMDFRGGKRPSTKPSSTTRLRRLAIYLDQNLDGVSLTAESSQSVRSLFLYAPPNFMVSNSSLFKGPKRVIDFNKLNFLRVLEFLNVNFEGEILPTEISKLIHLKYLCFSSCCLQELPSWIGGLPFLQVLLLGLHGEPKIPNVLWKIKGLKVLILPQYFVVEEKLVLDGLDELETLDGFKNQTCEITDLSKLQNLQFLSAFICGNDNLSKFMDSIEANVKCLDYTIIVVVDCDFGSGGGMALLKQVFKSSKIHSLMLAAAGAGACISKLPDYEPFFFPNLGELYLHLCEISEDPMGTLEKLSNLKRLVISQSFVGEEMSCHANGFPQLRHLELKYLSNLKKWRVEEGAMPCLSYLEVTYCRHLDMIPDGIRYITTLQTLSIEGMPAAFRKRVEEGGEDFDKVCHVNSIMIKKD